MKRSCFALCLAMLLVPLAASGAVWYVDSDNASGTEDGTSWPTAFRDIQSAVNAANSGGDDEVWVAAGTYTSTTSSVVAMVAGVDLYGGFAGTETTEEFDLRDPASNPTIIDGEGARRGVVAATATIEGFTITRGSAPAAPYYGGGMDARNASPTVTNCVFEANDADDGAGFYCTGGSPTITDCTFKLNTGDYGAGVRCAQGSPTLTNCRFFGNYADEAGGAILFGSGTLTATGCLFAGNDAYIGGGVSAGGATAILFFNECTFASNEGWREGAGARIMMEATATFSECRFIGNDISGNGGGIYSEEATVTAANCLFVGNNSLYGGGYHAWDDGHVTLSNCTFRRNTAYFWDAGCSIYIGYNRLTMNNCILWEGAEPDGTPNEVYFYSLVSPTTLTHCDIAGDLPGWVPASDVLDADPLFRPGYAGTLSGLSHDETSYTSVATDATASFTPGALAGLVLLVAPTNPNDPPRGYLITANTATTMTVWADATRGGTITAPREYEVLDWHLRSSSPCVDAGMDTSGASYGSVVEDVEGDARGYDGLDDGPTGAPGTGDGSDYDIGADEYAETPDLAVTSIDFDPVQPVANEEFTIEVTVQNVGLGDAGASKLSIEVPGDASPSTHDVPALEPGQSHVVQRAVTLGAGVDYEVTAIADVEAAVEDPNPANNALTELFTVFTFHPCDVDHDGDIDAVDVQLVINGALDLDTQGHDVDVDNDVDIDAVDIQMVINAALGIES